ncbi:hypothetical protein HKD37_03G007166 [Glycine soja]
MVLGFVSRLGWSRDGRAPLVVVRSRTADGRHPLVVVMSHHVLWGSTINTCLIFYMLVEGLYGCDDDLVRARPHSRFTSSSFLFFSKHGSGIACVTGKRTGSSSILN